jgi:hypothetical protein
MGKAIALEAVRLIYQRASNFLIFLLMVVHILISRVVHFLIDKSRKIHYYNKKRYIVYINEYKEIYNAVNYLCIIIIYIPSL